MTDTAPSTLEFRYRGRGIDGRPVHGHMRASSHDEVVTLLHRQSVFPFDVRAVSNRQPRSTVAARRSVPPSDLAVGLRTLAVLLQADVPLQKTIAAFSALAPRSWMHAQQTVAESINAGRGLGRGLRDADAEIPETVLGTIEAGEASGQLAAAILRAAEYAEADFGRRQAVRSALAYPMLLLIVGGAAVATLTTVVIPRFAAILGDLGQQLPASTRFVLGVSSALARWAPAIGVTSVILLPGFIAWRATPRGGQQYDAFLLRMPIVGPVRFSAAAARFAAALSSLLTSGLPISGAMAYAARASGNSEVEARALRARDAVVEGARISVALRANSVVTPAACALISAGDESGQVAAMLAHAAQVEQQRADLALARMIGLIEPALIIVFAGLVTLVAAALLQAVYSIRPGA